MFKDYDPEDFIDEMGNNFGSCGYNPFNSDDDEENEPKYKTIIWRSYFLVFWPKSFSAENLAVFGIGNKAADGEEPTGDDEDEAVTKKVTPKPKSRKPADFECEYAKSARSSCVQCEQKIGKDVLRIGLNVMHEEVIFWKYIFESTTKMYLFVFVCLETCLLSYMVSSRLFF